MKLILCNPSIGSPVTFIVARKGQICTPSTLNRPSVQTEERRARRTSFGILTGHILYLDTKLGYRFDVVRYYGVAVFLIEGRVRRMNVGDV